MKTQIELYDNLKQKVTFCYKQLRLDKYEKSEGRPLAIAVIDTLSMAIFKQNNNIATKKAIFKIFKPECVYKTLVVNMNRFAVLALIIFKAILRLNQINSHPIKHTDSTDVPVCLNKNAGHHKTMRLLSEWGHSGKGLFYGLKLHITTDLQRNLLNVRFSCGNASDREIFLPLNKDLFGLFIADAGYISKDLAKKFYIENKRMLVAKPRKNMKKIMTELQAFLYDTRMLIELNFRSLKMFYGLITSLPRSINGYLANYIYSLLAYQIA